MDFNNILKRDLELINKLIQELEVEYELDFMLINFKSMFLSIETNRTRAIAVLKIDDKKTKRVQVKTISSKLENREEVTFRLSVFIFLFRQIKAMKESEEIEEALEKVNNQLLYAGYKHFKELKI